MASAKWRPFCLGHNVLNDVWNFFSQVKKDEELDTRRAVAVVESILQMFIERMGTVTDYYEHWKVHVSTGKEFKTQWAQFVAEARKVRGLCK